MSLLFFLGMVQSCWAEQENAAKQEHSAGPRFDNKTALEISQAAIGKTVSDHVLMDAGGQKIKLSDLRGKPLVVSLIYTSCYHICPMTTRHLARVVRIAREALGADSFNVVSIGFDTANDSPEAMRVFAAQQAVDIPGWRFLSIDADTLSRLAEELGFIYTPSAMGFDHLIQATVIDAEGKIYRQVYDMDFDTPMLVEPLKELVFGQPQTGSILTHLGNRIRLFCTVYDPKRDGYVFDYSIFIGMIIGLTSMGVVGFLLFREWRRTRAV